MASRRTNNGNLNSGRVKRPADIDQSPSNADFQNQAKKNKTDTELMVFITAVDTNININKEAYRHPKLFYNQIKEVVGSVGQDLIFLNRNYIRLTLGSIQDKNKILAMKRLMDFDVKVTGHWSNEELTSPILSSSNNNNKCVVHNIDLDISEDDFVDQLGSIGCVSAKRFQKKNKWAVDSHAHGFATV